MGRENQSVVADLDGTLLRSRSSFPYFALIAFEAGGFLRLLFLLVASPLAGFLYYFVSESAGIQVLVFFAFAGLKISDIDSVARAVLPKFYSEDLHPESWRVFSSCGRRCVITANPTLMVEPFLKDYLGADVVVGTEIGVRGRRATGFVKNSGVLVGNKKAAALKEVFGECSPEIGLGDRKTDIPFMNLCKESYVVQESPSVEADRRRLSPPHALRLPRLTRSRCPRHHQRHTPSPKIHRPIWRPLHLLPPHLLDPIFLSTALGRPIAAVTYSVSRLSEILSPIKTVRLTRDRTADAAMIKKLLEEGDLVICPEGTTCREPFLLRFSALFAELTDEIVPVAMANKMSMFHGTTARGWKGMDPFYFFMNPSPAYEVTFLNKLPRELTCGGGGRSSHDVANYIQRLIAASLSYECTSFTRKDKYKALAGNDGTVVHKPKVDPNHVMGC
ncbi:putative glycerol-3-phosphate acyltransferase 8 [Acorus calamus]|uniref:Glycerol-3-phosphate acyltransferase 8 n=1 Tax=Acorus calamus TaxID=4465 RepID=A0AAV9EMW4_ACOCL|nr:putative glycerol-3-phosphate acyltransferase 8 [Acorus calamus]